MCSPRSAPRTQIVQPALYVRAPFARLVKEGGVAGMPSVEREHGAMTSEGRVQSVNRIFTSWNQIVGWLRQVEGLRCVA
jgi:hypothetical protein